MSPADRSLIVCAAWRVRKMAEETASGDGQITPTRATHREPRLWTLY
jgi:hypothetical protein